MRSGFVLPAPGPRLHTDLRILFGRGTGSRPSISQRALALDRIAGSAFVAGMALLGLWLAAPLLSVQPITFPLAPDAAEASSGTPGTGILLAARGPIVAADVRRLQSRLHVLGFDPGPLDGIAGIRTLNALNAYRAARNLERVSYVDRSTIADLLN